VLGAVVPAYNVPGVKQELKFTGKVLADIFMGKISTWNEGAIGYIELIYALQNNISFGSVQNAAGQFVKASLASTTAAAATAKMPADFRVSITNATGKESYPIASFTWLLVPAQWKDANKGKVMVDFLNWMLDQGQGMVSQLNYAPLPKEVADKERAVIKTIK
jgi:phosphate transport system substrate-binding protein